MPALPAVPKVVRVDHHWGEEGAPNVQIRNFFQYSGSLNVTDAATWLVNIVAAMGTFMTNRFNTDTTLSLSELTDLSSNTSPQVQNSTGHVGAVAGEPVQNGVALVIKHEILRRYRGGHPRTYLPGMLSAYLTLTNRWDPTALGNVVGSFAAYIAACVANTNPPAIGTITHVNVSYFQGFTNHTYPSGRVKAIPTPRATPLIDQVAGYVGNPIVASQRRRNDQP